ncbi:Histone-lysine N-methyltransferase SETMAR [Araneus ventricosus]|uniref:Histone-lysine N-methyltransferase SETMAR n=1 Tax=Araneus ventricosus TaxID=182803 RepID=A0A4Y2JLN8_ARAVE|nr:Histone-lysine N-methyltransferase SETMAR [Araneus ventricosus]
MFKIIESPAPCEVRSVIRFLSAKNLSAADIHRQICEVYGATAMCEGKVRKIIASVFWDRHDVLSVDFMQRRTTINAVAYGQIPRKLRRAIQNKRRGMLTEGILLLHDNARPHTAAQTRALLNSFGWEVLEPPFSPDLASSDFHLFRHLKHHLGGNDDEDVKTAVTSWLLEQAASFYEEGIQNLVLRSDNCLNKLGRFVEK